jgi:hypothetical protein
MSMLYVGVAAAAVMGGLNSFIGNRNQQAQATASAQAADYNSAVQKQKADQTVTAFNMREEAKRRENRIIAGKRAAAIAQSGTGFEGSNIGYANQQGVMDELDALNIRYQGQLEASGLLADSELSHWNAENYREMRTTLRGQSLLQTASGALQGGMSAYAVGASGRAAAAAAQPVYGP